MKIIDTWFENHSTMTENDYCFIKKLEKQLEEDKQKIKALSEKEKVIRPIRTFKIKDAIITTLKENPDGLTINDIVKNLGDESIRATIYGYLSKFCKKNLVDKSTTRPIVYYWKENGDPISRELLKNSKGIKIQKMG